MSEADLKRCMFYLLEQRFPSDEELSSYVIDPMRLEKESHDLGLLELAALFAHDFVHYEDPKAEYPELDGKYPVTFDHTRLADGWAWDDSRQFRKKKLIELVPILQQYAFCEPSATPLPELATSLSEDRLKRDEKGHPLWSFHPRKLSPVDLQTCLFFFDHDRFPLPGELKGYEESVEQCEPDDDNMKELELAAMVANGVFHLPHPSYMLHQIYHDLIGKQPANFNAEIYLDEDCALDLRAIYKVYRLDLLQPILAKYDFNNNEPYAPPITENGTQPSENMKHISEYSDEELKKKIEEDTGETFTEPQREKKTFPSFVLFSAGKDRSQILKKALSDKAAGIVYLMDLYAVTNLSTMNTYKAILSRLFDQSPDSEMAQKCAVGKPFVAVINDGRTVELTLTDLLDHYGLRLNNNHGSEAHPHEIAPAPEVLLYRYIMNDRAEQLWGIRQQGALAKERQHLEGADAALAECEKQFLSRYALTTAEA
jgi:hypothetical protein